MTPERGRSRHRHFSNDDFVALDYLSTILNKYNIDSKDFFPCLIEAKEKQESQCGEFTIQFRKETKETAVFLITQGSDVVTQLPIPKELLKGSNPFNDFIPTKTTRRSIPKRNENEPLKIKDLKFGMKKIKLIARVVEISKPKNVYTRLGKLSTIANAIISDETGSIQLPLWNQQIQAINVGDTIRVENARYAIYKGRSQLRIGTDGRIIVDENACGIGSK